MSPEATDTDVRGQILDGKALAARLREELGARIAAGLAEGRPRPGLATVLVGEDPHGVANRTAAQEILCEIEEELTLLVFFASGGA